MRDGLLDVLLALYPYMWYLRDSEISEYPLLIQKVEVQTCRKLSCNENLSAPSMVTMGGHHSLGMK